MNQPDRSCPMPCSFFKLVLLKMFGCSCRVCLMMATLAAFLVCLPWLLEETSLRDRVLAGIINIDSVNVKSQSGSCGYLTPCSVEGLRIEAKNATTLIEVDRIDSEMSWLQLWLSKPELGKFQVYRPKIDVVIPSKKKVARKSKPKPPTDQNSGKPAQRPGTEPSQPTNSTPDRAAADSPPRKSSATTAVRLTNVAKPAASQTSGKTKVINKIKKGFFKLPVITAEIEDAQLAIRNGASPEPTIDLKDLDVTFRIEQHQGQPVLKIEETTLFDHHRLTGRSFRGGMQLVAPLMANKIDAEGEFSVHLERFEVPLGRTQRMNQRERELQVEGTIEFHRASVAIKDSIATKISEVVNRLTFYSGPNRIYVKRGTKVRVKMVNGRVYHHGLNLLLPFGDSSIKFVSSGSVGLNETLDLQVAVHPPLGPLKHTFIAKRMRQEPIMVRFGGTLDNPRLMRVKMEWVASTLEDLIPGQTPEEFDRQMTGILDGMVKTTSETVKPILKAPVFMKMRSRIRNIPFFRK